MLRKAGKLHARHRAMMFLLRWLICLLAVVPLLMLADVLFHFPDAIRLAGGLGWLLAALGATAIACWIAGFTRPPLLRIARLLESRNPELGSKLINILQLDAESAKEDNTPLTRELARRAVGDAAKSIDPAALTPLAREPRLPRRTRHLALTACVLGLLTLVGGPHVRQAWLRFLDPYGDHPPFSLTRLEILKPKTGDEVLYGGSFTVEARATGHQPSDLFLTAVSLDKPSRSITLPMFARGDGTFVARLENIVSPLELTAHTRNNASRSHRKVLNVILTPQFGPVRLTLTPPEYTGQPPREMPYRFTAVQALEGTRIGFHITSNRPLGEGSIQLETGGESPSRISLTPSEISAPETAIADFIAESSGRMTFFLVDSLGNNASDNPTATLTVARDQPPAIAITVPEEDALVIENFKFPITIDATDDFGLRSMRLHIGVNDRFLTLDPVIFDKPDTRRHRIEHPLDLAAIGAKPGDQITIFAEAIDTRPDPQITRTNTRRMEVITEDDYNDLIREQSDVAEIAGKYEDLLKRFENQLAEQKRIEERFADLQERAAAGESGEEILKEFSSAFADQYHLNESLKQMADEMENFGREDPVYDFEKDLHENLREQAQAIRESAEQAQADAEKALEAGPPPPAAPTPEMMQGMEQAAREQSERLQAESEAAENNVLEPLQDLAHLHELMKDFNLFRDLTDEQKELADQSKAYQDKPDLNAEDRLALRDLGARQRDMARKLDQLARKLRHDAGAAQEAFPEAAESARELADQMDAAAMPGLARDAARNMLDAKAPDAHAQAEKLHQEMDRLFQDQAQPGQQGVAGALDRALRLNRRMNPGDALRQMMLSKKFRPLPDEGGGGGAGGEMANSAMDAQPMLLGGETLMDGPIADSIAGRGDGDGKGLAGAPSATLDRADLTQVDQESARRTTTPGSSTLLMEYENIADAYFRRLTTRP